MRFSFFTWNPTIHLIHHKMNALYCTKMLAKWYALEVNIDKSVSCKCWTKEWASLNINLCKRWQSVHFDVNFYVFKRIFTWSWSIANITTKTNAKHTPIIGKLIKYRNANRCQAGVSFGSNRPVTELTANGPCRFEKKVLSISVHPMQITRRSPYTMV